MTFKPRLGTLPLIIFLAILIRSQAQRFCLEPCLCHGDRISCKDADLEEIPPFVTINGAHIVDLSKNNILAVDRHSFAWGGTVQLQFVYLSANSIVYVESGAFDDLVNLEHMDLSNNELQFVPTDIVKENGRMRLLNLAQNMLTHEVPIIISDSLRVLDVSWNKLDRILPETFANLPSLERLELQSNNFQYISTETFSIMPSLMYVDLNINMWPCNCSSQQLFDYVASRGLFNATAPIICRQTDASTNEIYLLQDGATVTSNYCYIDNQTNPTDLLELEANTINVTVHNNLSTILTANDLSILTDTDTIALSPDVQSKDVNTTITVYHFRYSMLNIVNMIVFIIMMVFLAKMLVMCLDLCRSLSDGSNTEESLLYKATQMQIV